MLMILLKVSLFSKGFFSSSPQLFVWPFLSGREIFTGETGIEKEGRYEMRNRYGLLTLPLLCALIVASFLAAFPISAEGARFYVTPGGAGANAGTSWQEAFSEALFPNALLAAAPGTEFWVAKGRYRPSTTDKTKFFPLNPGVALYGGFAGTETARDQRNWKVNVTVLTGDLNFDDNPVDANGITLRSSSIQGTNSVNVMNAQVSNAATILDGFVITAGDSNTVGGGILNPLGGVAIRNCSFYGNRASQDGGALYMESGSTSTVTDCTFSGNAADSGAAIYNNGSATLIQRCFFEANFAVLQNGGAIFTLNSPFPEVDGCTFFKNKAGDRGGGIYATNNVRVTACTFIENEAADGGGIFAIGSEPVVTNCTFSGNTASVNGGGMQNYWAATTIVTNCTFSGNTAAAGGNMYNADSDPTVTNSIFWAGVNGEITDDAASNPVVSYCVVQGGYGPGSNIITGDPKLGPLATNGGPTETMALLSGSSALDAGTSTGAPSVDQRGISRPQGSGYDIGAFEVEVGGGGGSGGGCSAGGGSLFALLLMLAPLTLLRRRG